MEQLQEHVILVNQLRLVHRYLMKQDVHVVQRVVQMVVVVPELVVNQLRLVLVIQY